LGTQDKNKHGAGNIGYIRYKQTRAWQHWVHKIQTDTGLTTLGLHLVYPMLPGPVLLLSCVPNVVRPVSVFILCTQCCQASVCFYLVYPMLPSNVCLYLVYPMLPGQCLFVSCGPNVARPVSVFILCTQCCQASICFYLVYPILPGPCLFLSCVPNLARSLSVFKIKTDTDLATLSTQDKNRHGSGNIGST
jgi:hypothetical protein